MEPKAIVIYDPDCGFCRLTLALLLSWDWGPAAERADVAGERPGGTERGRPSPPQLPVRWGRSAAPAALRPLPLGTPEADRLLADLSLAQRAASWHLVLDDGARTSAGAALAPALRLLPGGGIPAALFARFPRTAERGYRWVADHRGLLGRFVPSRARRWADRVIVAHGGP
ncbi:MAG: DCC1-like thiol-disulfide oxidoreductase [Solirubrobacterales bacterium]|nr:DCC1-like thiol-disulfide oxidoreductase [Solirubrobacterales bacterium]